jgi:hypothetical protein
MNHYHRVFHFAILASLLLMSTTLLALRSQVATFITRYSGQTITLAIEHISTFVKLPSEASNDRSILAAEVATMSIAMIALTFAAMAWPARMIVSNAHPM